MSVADLAYRIETGDLQRDRLACWAATPRVQATKAEDSRVFRAILAAHMPIIDLRSDTVTKPTPEMRRAMAEAEVGDDVFGDDPTVRILEERAAELLGKEAGLFVSSGAMGNLVAQLAHVQRGQEVIAGTHGHIMLHEAASYAVVVGASVRPIDEQPDGRLTCGRCAKRSAIPPTSTTPSRA